MTAIRRPRTSPYVQAKWLSKLLSGDSKCVWSVWFKAHHFYERRVSEGEGLANWQIEHGPMVKRIADGLEKEGFDTSREKDNQFKMKGRVGTLAGTPDVIATRGRTGTIVDVKTGKPRDADRFQVLLYMLGVRLSHPKFLQIQFDGRVIYKSGEIHIPADAVDGAFVADVRQAMETLCDKENEPERSPGLFECRYCDVRKEDCGAAFEEAEVPEVEVDVF